MKSLTITAAATTLIATLTNADVQKIDVSSMTCSQFIQSDEARVNLILTWFLGFYSDAQNPQVIDLTKLDNVRSSFMTFCKQQPTFYLTTAAEGLMGK
jgi:acid stress chaperone HdeB